MSAHQGGTPAWARTRWHEYEAERGRHRVAIATNPELDTVRVEVVVHGGGAVVHIPRAEAVALLREALAALEGGR
jgi:hypothetical protein